MRFRITVSIIICEFIGLCPMSMHVVSYKMVAESRIVLTFRELLCAKISTKLHKRY